MRSLRNVGATHVADAQTVDEQSETIKDAIAGRSTLGLATDRDHVIIVERSTAPDDAKQRPFGFAVTTAELRAIFHRLNNESRAIGARASAISDQRLQGSLGGIALDSGRIFASLTDRSLDRILRAHFPADLPLVITDASHTLRELEDIADQLWSDREAHGINSVAVDERKNGIFVGIEPSESASARTLARQLAERSGLSNHQIEVSFADYDEERSSGDFWPPSRAGIPIDPNGILLLDRCSTGFAVRFNATGAAGILTAGHCVRGYPNAVWQTGTGPNGTAPATDDVGEIVRINYGDLDGEPSADVGVIRLDDQTIAEDRVYRSRARAGVDVHTETPIGSDIQGMTVFASLGVSDREISGELLYRNLRRTGIHPQTGQRSVFHNLRVYSQSVASRGGDSGSPIYHFDGSNRLIALGIHNGRAMHDGAMHGYFTHMGYAETSLNVDIMN